MEPIYSAEIYKLVNNPEEARKLLTAYYQRLGYHVVGMPDLRTTAAGEKQLVWLNDRR